MEYEKLYLRREGHNQCLLSDGRIEYYDMMDSTGRANPDESEWEYLGEGRVYSVDFKIQKKGLEGRFWKRKTT